LDGSNSSASYFVDFAAGIAIGITMFVMADPDLAFAVAFVIALFIIWPIFEWWMHKRLLHGRFRREHWRHHRHPGSDDDVVFPLWLTVAAQLVIVTAAVAVFGWSIGAGAAAGLAFGYGSYTISHWFIHSGRRRGPLAPVGRRHDLHHEGMEVNFNLLNPIGDILFGTYVPVSKRMNGKRRSAL
jgi:sterol desaturase/sphingolipid hydroxylase (fatty acid hydroxylase superfamily)